MCETPIWAKRGWLEKPKPDAIANSFNKNLNLFNAGKPAVLSVRPRPRSMFD